MKHSGRHPFVVCMSSGELSTTRYPHVDKSTQTLLLANYNTTQTNFIRTSPPESLRSSQTSRSVIGRQHSAVDSFSLPNKTGEEQKTGQGSWNGQGKGKRKKKKARNIVIVKKKGVEGCGGNWAKQQSTTSSLFLPAQATTLACLCCPKNIPGDK